MKFKSIHKQAEQLDGAIDDYIKSKNSVFVPINTLREMAKEIFPDAKMANYGLHKLVFLLQHKSHKLALKIGKMIAIEQDHQAYKRMPRSLRRVYFARIFWHTKYCLLQEFGAETEVTSQELSQIRAVASKYGLLDISCDNIRNVNGHLKIIDAGISPPGFFRLWKSADFIILRLPSPLRQALRKSRLLKIINGK